MEKLSFTKMSGAGNDFIILDKDNNIPFVLSDFVVQKLCDRRNGIGADGVIIVADSENHAFEMEYFNSDGSTRTLCGNGARCAVKFAELTGRLKVFGSFLSGGIEYSGEILKEDKVKFNLQPPGKIKLNFMVKAARQMIKAHYADTGSPHVVINIKDLLKYSDNPASFYNDISGIPVFELGREIRNLPEFAPGGVNVNFILLKDEKLFIRTYERGVENETLACGTGSAAAALISGQVLNLKPPVTLVTLGGDELIVNFIAEGTNISDLSLTGPAKITFSGSFLYKDFF